MQFLAKIFLLLDDCVYEDTQLVDGEVETCTDGEWKTVCGSGWTKNAHIVCKNLENDDTLHSMLCLYFQTQTLSIIDPY